jgi:hypothetical protein
MKILIRIILSILVVAIFMVPAASAIGHQTATFIKGGEVGLLAYTLWSALYCGVLAASFLSALFIWSPGLSVEFWRCKEVKTKTRPPQVQQCIDKGRACTADDLTKLSLDDMQTVLAYFKKRDPGHWRALSAQIDRLGKGDKDQEPPLTAALRQRAEGITQGLKAAGLGQPKPAHADVTNILLTGELQTLFKAVKGLHGKSREGAGDSPDHAAVMRDALVLLGYALQPNTWHLSVWAENGQSHIHTLWHPKVQDAVALVNAWDALPEDIKIRATQELTSLELEADSVRCFIARTDLAKKWRLRGSISAPTTTAEHLLPSELTDLVLGQEVVTPEERKGETAHPSSFAELVDQAPEQEAPQTKDTDAA